jgi:hypothetical protein
MCYTVEKPSTIWIILGASQVFWAFRQFSAFQRIASWAPALRPLHTSTNDDCTALVAPSIARQAEHVGAGR